MTFSITSFFNFSWLISSSCCVETNMVSILFGLSFSYSTVTCVFPSGLKYLISLFLLTSVNLLDNLCAIEMAYGMYSGVSSQANPNIMPWSPAPPTSTPNAISGLCFVILISILHVL